MTVPTIAHRINGQTHDGGDRHSEVFDPASGRVSARLRLADAATVGAAVAAASTAWPAWAATPPLHRARVLQRFRELLAARTDTLAACITAEHGKTLDDARGEVQRGLEVVEFACGIPQLLKGTHSTQVGRGIDSWSRHEPLGVVAGITPFNFPAMVPLWMIPIALACGNAFILKPSERTPSAALQLADLLAEAGLPAGVFNVVQGDSAAVEALIDAPAVQAVSFVGSTAVAEQVYRRAAARGIRAQALGGAKNHLVVLPDADIARAGEAVLGAAFGSAGERCMAVSVAVAVGAATADALRDYLLPRIRALRVGDGRDNPDMGPLVTAAHRQRVAAYLQSGLDEGAELCIDGRDHPACREPGFFLGPSLFDRVQPSMRIYREEVFGPLLCLLRADSLEAAIALINGHEYGNGSCLFTDSGAAARQFTQSVQAGMVGINVPIPVPAAFHSFGGWKRSLFGPLHMHGPDGVRFYTRLKTVSERWPGAAAATAGFSMPQLD